MATTTGSALEQAKAFYEKALALPYPDGFRIGPWWQAKQEKTRARIAGFRNCEEAVLFAQRGEQTGFDHRFDPRVDTSVAAHFKARELERLFPSWRLKDSPFVESPFSSPDSFVKIDGGTYSSIFFTHVKYYLESTKALQTAPRRVLEIGGGYGALARVFKLADAATSYVIVDLPESLFYAHCFLALNFPQAKIDYAGEARPQDVSSLDFLLVPVQTCKSLQGEPFDIVINTGSLQEMPPATVAFWMEFIQKDLKASLFYSFNYFLVNKKAFDESSHADSNKICPVLDPWWTVRHFEINPDVLTIDADGRNWLEVCVERIESGDDAEQRASDLFARANRYPPGSNYWFADVWMAIWCDPREEYLRAMTRGIEIFRDQIKSSLAKNFFSKTTFQALVKNAVKKAFFKKRCHDLFSELDFYQGLLASSASAKSSSS